MTRAFIHRKECLTVIKLQVICVTSNIIGQISDILFNLFIFLRIFEHSLVKERSNVIFIKFYDVKLDRSGQ